MPSVAANHLLRESINSRKQMAMALHGFAINLEKMRCTGYLQQKIDKELELLRSLRAELMGQSSE